MDSRSVYLWFETYMSYGRKVINVFYHLGAQMIMVKAYEIHTASGMPSFA